MAEEDLQNWSSKLEDLIDDGDTEGAKKLLEGIVANLESRSDAPINLRLAAALNDLAALYNSEGLSIKADSLFNSALLIKNRLEKSAGKADQRVGSVSANHSGDEGPTYQVQNRAGEPSTSGSNHEEDWEATLCKDTVKMNGLLAARKTSEISFEEKNITKQRGRGAFTFGEMGMYSDRLSMFSLSDGEEQDDALEETEGAREHLSYGVGHVLVIERFPPKATTKDLEDLFEPVATNGVAIRWVNDTTALAVFRNPYTAREALRRTQNPQFKIHELDEDSRLCGLFKERDLEPPAPRPATSSQAAQRMIMGALRKQGLSKTIRSNSNFQDLQRQEDERKQRLLTRQKLRDEAWGPDG